MEKLIDSQEMQYIIALKTTGQIYRQGILFTTSLSNYLYDSGTGKVFKLKEDIYNLLNVLLSHKSEVQDVLATIRKTPSKSLEEFLLVSKNSNLFRIPNVKHLTLSKNPLGQIKNELQQLVLEVTEKCNFRCKYCIYSEDFDGNRSFGNKDMDEKTADLSIDYAFEHAGEALAVSFYGGEPLENLSLIKHAIEYSKEKNKKYQINLSFNMTTNLSLMTKEIAYYLANVEGMSLVLSLDGPEDVQNAGRVYPGGKGTFSDAMRGLNFVAEEFKKTNRPIAINAVLIPPYSFEKLDAMNQFYESLTMLSDTTPITVTYTSEGTYNCSDYCAANLYNPKYKFVDAFNPLVKWQFNKAKLNGLTSKFTRNMYTKAFVDRLMPIHNRMLQNDPDDFYLCNGCCTPGARRIYVETNGDMLICERIGNSPIVGTAQKGLNINVVQEKYIDEYIDKSLPLCKECWAVNMCKICYAACYDKRGLNLEEKLLHCESMRKECRDDLVLYHELLEVAPKAIEIIKQVVQK